MGRPAVSSAGRSVGVGRVLTKASKVSLGMQNARMDNRRRNRDWPNVVSRGNVRLGPGGRLGHGTRCVCGVAMPIRPYLDGHAFDAETVRLLSIAFEITRAGIKVEEWDEPGDAIIAAPS